GVERLGLRLDCGVLHQVGPPMIPAFDHRDLDLLLGASKHNNMLDAGCGLERLVSILLERHDRSPPKTSVLSYEYCSFSIVNPIGQRHGRKAAEYYRV